MKNSSTRIIGLLIAIVALQMPGWLFAPITGQKMELLNALMTNDFPVVQRLLNAGVNPNEKIEGARPGDWSTPLHFAVEARSPRMVKLLLDKGANPHIKDTYGNTALGWATEKLKLVETYSPRPMSDADSTEIANLREIMQKMQMVR